MIGPNGKLREAPETVGERQGWTDIIETVSDNHNLEVRDGQEVEWYFEQQLWNQLGVRSKPESFAEGARTYARRYGDVFEGEAGRKGAVQKAPLKQVQGGPTGPSVVQGSRGR